MATREKERCSRIDFLWRVSHHYFDICPELAAFWGSKLLDMSGPAPVTDRLCPGCGSLLLPSPSVRLRTLSRKTLRKMRRKKKVIWLTTPLPQANTYVLVKCRCGGSYVTGGNEGGLSSRESAVNTPKPARRKKRSLSATLKNLLEASSRQQTQRQRSSPSLSLFLTALNSS